MWSWITRLTDWLRQPPAKVQERRARFASGRRCLSDQEFLAEVGCEERDLGRLILFVRRMFGTMCGVDAQMIHPSDDPNEMWGIIDWSFTGMWGMGEEWNPSQFMDYFREELCRGGGLDLKGEFADELPPFGTPPFGWKGKRPQTFAEWVREAGNVILAHLPDGWQQALPEYPRRKGDSHQIWRY